MDKSISEAKHTYSHPSGFQFLHRGEVISILPALLTHDKYIHGLHIKCIHCLPRICIGT